MRRVGSAVVTAWAAAAVMVLAGCGGGGDGNPGADPGVLTIDAVREDLRAALKAGGFEQASFLDDRSEAMRRRPCQVMGQLRTPTAPDRKATERAVAELEKRGWQATEPMADENGTGWALDRSGWTLSLLSGTASEEGAGAFLPTEAQDPAGEQGQVQAFEGLSFHAYGQECGQAAATASP
ncbi:hypothetical protein [Streptomyces sp. S.PB5]|uniref:hypothetical protein n=1 Tax=Streptomyces sp. S.PB5 TaxID=3020844 RepID=UPI0025B1DA46|nr:hypothetical protein [Streptomyces sp. S.PB5]MDN3020563.1 hypothetical protein [Streptomyces sp. S.PB5]